MQVRAAAIHLRSGETDTKKIGPSFKEVATKYKGKADTAKVLVDKLSAGKDHPATKASPAEITGLVKWVLATP